MNGKLLCLVVIFVFFGCNPTKNHDHLRPIDKLSMYIINNEKALNADLDKAIIEHDKMFPEPHGYTTMSTVYLSQDTSLNDSNFKLYPHIGQFAAYVQQINKCLLVSYTYKKDTSQGKIITVFKDFRLPCMINIDTILASVDTTEHFVIVKTNEPTDGDMLELGNQTIQVKNLRFKAIRQDSLMDIEVFINSDSSNFILTSEVVSKMPGAIFGKDLLVRKIRNVDVKLKSEGEKDLLTYSQFQREITH